MKPWPFAWGFGLVAGAALAAMLGVYGPSWGVALVFPIEALIFGIATQFEDEPEHLANILRFIAAASIGFTMLTMPINLYHLLKVVADAPDLLAPAVAERAAAIRGQLWPRWAVIALALPIGVIALVIRLVRRLRREGPRARTEAM